MTSKPLVSVIVPTKDSGATIGKCLESIRNQTYPKVEVIVVDDFSRDNTREIAEKFGVKAILESKAGRSRARNIGTKKATGDLVLSMDSDMELTPRVIDECVNKINGGYDAVIIPEISVGIGFWADCKTLEKRCYLGDDKIEASRFFRKSVVESLGGYDSKLEAGEDWDMNQRIREAGYKIARVNSFVKHNEGKLTLWKAIKKKHRYSKTLKRYERKQPLIAKQQLKLIRPAFVKNWRKLAKDPAHALGIIFLKACELMATKIGTIGESNAQKNKPIEEHATHRVRLLTKELSGKLNLDAGCGQGTYAKYFRGQVVGLDLDLAVLKMSKGKYADVVQGSIAFLPFKARAFDFVLGSEVLEHLVEAGGIKALKELEMVASGILITTPNRNALFSILSRIVYGSENPEHVSRWSSRRLRERQFDVHGCLGWVSSERIPRIFHRLWDLLSWNFPDLFGGDLIAVKLDAKK